MTYTDPVQVLRDAINRATGAKTVRVIQEGSLPDTWPMPLVHVYAAQSQDLDFERAAKLRDELFRLKGEKHDDIQKPQVRRHRRPRRTR